MAKLSHIKAMARRWSSSGCLTRRTAILLAIRACRNSMSLGAAEWLTEAVDIGLITPEQFREETRSAWQS